MSDLPSQETDDSRDIDHGEMSRRSPRHLPPGPLNAGDKTLLFGFLAAAATLAVALAVIAR